MTRMLARFVFLVFVCGAFSPNAFALQSLNIPGLPGATGTSDGGPRVKELKYPGDLRDFRIRALVADGYFAPDIAFALRTCPACKEMYVFSVLPRLSRTPYDSLSAVHRSIEEALTKPAPKIMYSPRADRMVPRACPYCGELENDAHPNRVYFCHQLLETGEDLHIDYTIRNGKLAKREFWRITQNGASAVEMPLTDDSEAQFSKAFGCHFSLRALWNEIFRLHWNDDKVYYENAAPGVWLIFRPEKVGDAAFKEFATNRLLPDKKKGLFTRVESLLKIDDASASDSTYVQWAPEFAEKLSKSTAECFVGIALPELRSVAAEATRSRKVTLNLTPLQLSTVGTGYISRGSLSLPLTLAPLVKLAATGGLSLHQASSFYLGDGCFKLDSAERLAKNIQALLPECDFAYDDGHIMIARDAAKATRKIDLFPLADKLDPDDETLFKLYYFRVLRYDAKSKRFGPPPLDREVSPLGLPAYIERRIRPAEHLIKHNLPGALFEPFFDSDGKRCDLCYTNECTSTVVFIDPQKPQFKDIPDANAARRLYYADGGSLPTCIEAQDVLRFAGGIPGLVECATAILCGSDVSSLASEAERASALADFAGINNATKRFHFYAFTTNCAALSPRKLLPDELDLLKSRVADFLKSSNTDPGIELNLHFDLPRSQPKGKVLRRKN